MQNYANDGVALTKTLILLPNRRACRTLRDAFLEQSDGKAMLLPRIQPIGDREEIPVAWNNVQQTAAINPMRRHMLLTRLVERYEQNRAGRPYSTAHAARLAEALEQLIDETCIQGISLDQLAGLAPDHLSAQWQQTLDFLNIISAHWPDILEQERVVDPAMHLRQSLLALAAKWKKTPPDFPVIAAGSTGSQPATAELLSVISRLPRGMVILPSLDTAMDKKSWDAISYTHPQYGLKQLLAHMECAYADVKPLIGNAGDEKSVCLRSVFAPAETTAAWLSQALPIEKGLSHISLCEAAAPLDEARMIAVMLRETLQTPQKTAALVTPDRTLARMVASQMQRLGVHIDDSAGMPLADTPPGVFVRLAAACAVLEAAPVALLSLMQHPLATAGESAAVCRSMARELDRHVLRGIRHVSGIAALCDDQNASVDLRRFLMRLRPAYERFAAYFTTGKTVRFTEILSEHVAFCEFMASDLWKGDAAAQLSQLMAEIAQHGDILDEIDPFDYAGLLDALLAGATYRPKYGLHPRLHILSPIEARMQQFDRVILSGLNEGVWPAGAQPDPWMSRPMRLALGLPPMEQAIGQSAHDFYTLCHAPEVIFTRARKMNATPSIASRWLIRLSTLVGGKHPEFLRSMDVSGYYESGKEKLDAPALLPALTRPMPCPPVYARPQKMRVTSVDLWVRDPYIIYAKYILGLRKLDALDEDPGVADFGMIIHGALELFVREYPEKLPEASYAKLLAIGRKVFSAYASRPAVAVLWWPRFEAIARWFIAREVEIRAVTRRVIAENNGRLNLDVDGRHFMLTTRLDRIEIADDGGITIADYKTGAVPSDKDIAQGISNQLALEALVARDGAFDEPIPMGGMQPRLCYWKLSANSRQAEIKHIDADVENIKQRLENLVRDFSRPDTPYAAQINPMLLPRYNDFSHLTRRQEWEPV